MGYFLTSGFAGGGRGLSSSGLWGFVPSPTCSHGDSDSKLLESGDFCESGRMTIWNYLPECLCKLKRLVNNAFTLLVISHFRVTLSGKSQWSTVVKNQLTVNGKSLRKGWPSKPEHSQHPLP